MSLQRLSALAVLLGSMIFLIAAFSPISRVYGIPSAPNRLDLITRSPRAWVVSQVLFGLGALVTALGVALAAVATRGRPSATSFSVAAGLLVIGAVTWSWYVYLRARDPQAFVESALPGWPFVVYTLLTMAAFLLIGFLLLHTGFPAWAAWSLIGGSLLFFILYVIFKDMPPFVHYVLGLILGVVLLRAG